MQTNDDYQYLGTITRPFGVKGECHLGDTDVIPALKPNTKVRLGYSAAFGKPAVVEYLKVHNGGAVIKLAGKNDISSVEPLRENGVFVLKSALTLEENAYFTNDIIGCTMVRSETNDVLGEIVDVWNLPTYNALVVRTPDGADVAVPDVPDFILSVDIPQRRVIAAPPDGLFGGMVSEED